MGMYEELEDRSPQKFDRILAVSFSMLFFIFSGFSSAAYLFFGPSVENDVIRSLPHDPWSAAGRIGVICIVCCVFPIWVYPMVSPLKAYAGHIPSLAALAKILVMAASWLSTLFVHSLGKVSAIDGALC